MSGSLPGHYSGLAGFTPSGPASSVEQDIPCRKCAYNLRGMSVSGRCPECGTPVGISTQGDLLQFSDPTWLATLAQGLRFMLWGALISIAASIVGSAVFNGPAEQWVDLVAGLLSVYGAWLMTGPDPSGLGEAQYATSRKLVRICLAAGLVGGIGQALESTIELPGLFRPLTVAASMVMLLCGAVGEFAKFVYLEKLATRIPDYELAGRARVLRWGYGGSIAVMVLIVGTALLIPKQAGIAACMLLVAALAYLIFGIMVLFFYSRMAGALKKQEDISLQIWATTPGH